jgi:hypothetical protein
MADSFLSAGYDEVGITPPLGGSMPGYFRDRKATGVLDPLKSKVLYLRRGDESVALVACDLIGMGALSVERIRVKVKTLTEAPPRHIWIHCTHTHNGGMLPRGGGFTSDAESIYPDFYPGTVDETWVGQMVDRTAAAIVQAANRARAEKKLTLHVGRETTLAHYRRFVMKDGTVRTNPGRGNPSILRPAGEIDPRVHVLKWHHARILLIIFGMHPDCVGGTRYSADYPHYLTEVLRHALGADWRVIFFNACCGNINHIDVNNPNQESGPQEAERIGQTLALAVLEALKKEQVLTDSVIAIRKTDVQCRLRKPAPQDIAEAEKLLRTYKETGKNPFGFNDLYAPAALVLARTKDREHRAEVAVMRVGSFGLAALPGEVFVELGREVETASPFRPTRTIGLTNGSLGYIPTRRGYAEGGYEAGYRSARYEPDTGHSWAKAAATLLSELGQ